MSCVGQVDMFPLNKR